MVVPCASPTRSKKSRAIGVPVVDLSLSKSKVSELIVKACEEYGIFKVINHGVHDEVVARLEDEGDEFFRKSYADKERAGSPNPFGYGCKNIGFNGDMGELEYILLHTNPLHIHERSNFFSNHPAKFSCAVNEYIEEVRELACEILELIAQGLWLSDTNIWSRLLRDAHNDSLLRLNHYHAAAQGINNDHWDPSKSNNRIGFGEHSDPQILTILRSNDVPGLQISLHEDLWLPVPPDPTSFYVIVGDALQAMTNGRLVSVRHRAVANSNKERMSTMYFGAPPLNAWISPIEEMVSSQNPTLYKKFTWAQYKKAAYTTRLGDRRLDLFKIHAP